MLIQLLQTLSGCVAYAAVLSVHGVYLSCSSVFFYFLFLELQFMRINLKVALATSWVQRQNAMTDNTVDKMGDLEWTVFTPFWHETPTQSPGITSHFNQTV